MKTTTKIILITARQMLRHTGSLGIFGVLYAGLLASLYGFVSTREATLGQVALTLVFLLLIPASFFLMQAAIIHHARDGRIGLRRALSSSGRLLVVTVPMVIVGIALFVILNRWEPQAPAGIALPSSWAAGGNWSPPNPHPASITLHWPTVLFATLRWVIFGVALPLVTISLWIEVVNYGWRALFRGGFRSLLQRAGLVLSQAFASESVITYAVGLVLFALFPYALLFVPVPVRGPRTEFAIFIARLALAFLLTLFGWVLTIATLARQACSEQPRSGCALQPWVAAAATQGMQSKSVSTPMGLWHLLSAFTQPSRRAATLGWRAQPLRGRKSGIV